MTATRVAEPVTAVGGLRRWVASVGIVWWRGNLRTLRFPGLLVVVAFFPIFFFVAFSGLFPSLTDIPGFPTDNYRSWLLPFVILQGAGFSGLGAGFMTGRDLGDGFFDRLLMMPAHRSAIYVGTVLMSVSRAVVVGVVVFGIGLVAGADLTGGALGLACLALAVIGISWMSASFALGVMYRARDERVAPLFQLGIFITLFTSTAQVPLSISTGWLHDAARFNPITNILELGRQATLPNGWAWSSTWPGLLALGASVVVLGAFALTGLRRITP